MNRLNNYQYKVFSQLVSVYNKSVYLNYLETSQIHCSLDSLLQFNGNKNYFLNYQKKREKIKYRRFIGEDCYDFYSNYKYYEYREKILEGVYYGTFGLTFGSIIAIFYDPANSWDPFFVLILGASMVISSGFLKVHFKKKKIINKNQFIIEYNLGKLSLKF